MNQPHETQVVVRLKRAIPSLLIILLACSVISYRIGKQQAYKEILHQYFPNAIAAALCFDAYQLHEKY